MSFAWSWKDYEREAAKEAAKKAAKPKVPQGAKPKVQQYAKPIVQQRTKETEPIVSANWLAAKRSQGLAPKPKAIDQGLLSPAPSRDPCAVCGVPGFKGCAHQLPYEAVPVPIKKDKNGQMRGGARHYQAGI